MTDPRITAARKHLYEAVSRMKEFKTGTEGDLHREIADMCTQVRTVRDRLREIAKEGK